MAPCLKNIACSSAVELLHVGASSILSLASQTHRRTPGGVGRDLRVSSNSPPRQSRVHSGRRDGYKLEAICARGSVSIVLQHCGRYVRIA
jgi:hypothetical protein